MIKLTARKAVVDQERYSLAEKITQAVHPLFGAQVDFRLIPFGKSKLRLQAFQALMV